MNDDPFLKALHADRGMSDDPAVAPPLHTSTTFDRSAQDDLVYRRYDDPTRRRLEAVLGALDGGHAVTYASGMAAIAGCLRVLAPRRVSLPDDVYHATRAFVVAEAGAGRWSVVAPGDLGEGDVLWVETPSNPKCLVTDIGAAADEMGRRGARVVVDATFATPVLQRPLQLGATAVVHSTTKFINGHSDAMGGVVVAGEAGLAAKLAEARSLDGAVPGSLDTWLTLRGVRTLPLRVLRQSQTALEVAEGLAEAGRDVWYPGLPSHPNHDVAVRQMAAFGGVLSFEVADAAAAGRLLERVRLARRATSLGGVETLIEHRLAVDPAAPPGLLRVSVGLEPGEAILDDLLQASD